MKTKTFLLLPLIALAACNIEEPSNTTPSTSSSETGKMLYKGDSPYLDWYYGNWESFVSYNLKIIPQDKTEKQMERIIRAEDKTITLSDDSKILLHDDYAFENGTDKTTLHLTRSATLMSKNANPTPIVHSFTYDIRTAQPINIIRPGIDECNPIPLCYYDGFEIEWNADPSNKNGVVIIAEWTGCTIYDHPKEVYMTCADIVEDTGVAVLDTLLFNGMPDEASVTLWLIRGNLNTVSGDNNEIAINELAKQSPEVLSKRLTEHPELLIELQPFAFGSGAVTSFSFFLIRNL